mgnify:CR=1 FL=1
MKAITAGLSRLDGAWADAWGQDRVLRLATDAPWPEVRAMHLRSQHQTVPFVLFVNLAFASLTAGIFTDAAGWAFMFTWIALQLLWALYVWSVWRPRQRRPYRLATPWAVSRVLLGAAAVSVLWSIAIWVWFSHADTDGRHFMVAIVVGNLCVGTLAMSSIASGVVAYVVPQVVATAVSLVVYPRSYMAFELVALVLLALVLCWFGSYISRVLTAKDVTGILHPTLADAAVKAARALDIPVVGLDLLVPAADQPDYVFIEANERAGLANHQPQPTAERFIDLLFPLSQVD